MLTLRLLLALSWQLTLVCMVAVPIVVVASVKFQRDSNKAYLTIRDRIGHNLSTLQEGITGVRVIQAFAREQAVGERFAESNQSLYDAHMDSVRISVWYLPLVEFAGVATTAAVVGIGGWLVHQGEVSLGTVVAFVLLLTNLFEPVQQLSQLFNTVQASRRVAQQAVRSARHEARRRASAGVPSTCRPTARSTSTDVSFAYGAASRWPTGGCCARSTSRSHPANGSRSSGRPARGSRRSRSWSPGCTTRSAGTISFGGVDLRDATLASLRDRIVVVPQEGFLFSGTIRDNVRIARAGASDADVDAALAVVGADERFGLLPEGFDTEVRERGSRLSAGERQLVSLARAALADPAVLVLDEATSSLDPGTEAMVERAMDRLMAGRTVVVIAHRLSTAERADRVGVVDQHDARRAGLARRAARARRALRRPLRKLGRLRARIACRPCGCGSTRTSAPATVCASTTVPTCSCSSRTASRTSARASGSATIPVAAAAWPVVDVRNERSVVHAALDCPGECIFIELD